MDTHEQIRACLKALRKEYGLSEPELARQMGLNKSMIYRIEDVSERPNYEVTIDTIIKWLDSTSGETLASFFFRVEFANSNDYRLVWRMRQIVDRFTANYRVLLREFDELPLPNNEGSVLRMIERLTKKAARLRRTPDKRRNTG